MHSSSEPTHEWHGEINSPGLGPGLPADLPRYPAYCPLPIHAAAQGDVDDNDGVVSVSSDGAGPSRAPVVRDRRVETASARAARMAAEVAAEIASADSDGGGGAAPAGNDDVVVLESDGEAEIDEGDADSTETDDEIRAFRDGATEVVRASRLGDDWLGRCLPPLKEKTRRRRFVFPCQLVLNAVARVEK